MDKFKIIEKRKKFKKYFTWEMAIEFYAAGYTLAILALYCIFAFINGQRSADILMMFQMLIVSYIIAVIQNIIFIGNKRFTKSQYSFRVALWHITSNTIGIIAAIIFKWFSAFSIWAIVLYIMFLISMFFVVWLFMGVNRDIDTESLNNLLIKYKSNTDKGE